MSCESQAFSFIWKLLHWLPNSLVHQVGSVPPDRWLYFIIIILSMTFSKDIVWRTWSSVRSISNCLPPSVVKTTDTLSEFKELKNFSVTYSSHNEFLTYKLNLCISATYSKHEFEGHLRPQQANLPFRL